MERYLSLIETKLKEIFDALGDRPQPLHEAMAYAVNVGGKRIRPIIALAAAEAVGGKKEDAIYPACAIEILHNYTLVHDDLPSMDNDTLRRGKPTVWAKYGECDALLVGDALQALAFRTAAKAPRNVQAIIEVLGEKALGVVQGQVEDIAKTGDADFIYTHKTADLFIAAAVMGGLAGGANESQVESLETFARNLGLAFQYEDDILDNDGVCEKEETLKRIESTTSAALEALAELPGDTSFLVTLARKLKTRLV